MLGMDCYEEKGRRMFLEISKFNFLDWEEKATLSFCGKESEE